MTCILPTDQVSGHPGRAQISREAQQRTGSSIKKILNTLRPLRTATITFGGHQITAEPEIPHEARELLNYLNPGV